jgi:DNA-binding transcriptional LysR family regulator
VRIEQLEYLAAVTEHGSLRRASEAMHISQPALSEAVTKLEKELGTTLLDRRRTGSRISRQGLDLLQNMTEVLEAVDRLRQAAGQQSARRRDLRIGTVVTASASLLAPALRDLHARHGSGGVEVVNGRQVDIQQGLAEGSLDLGLVNVLPGDEVPPTLVADRLIEGTPVSVGTMDADALAVPASVPVDDATALSVTVEPAGGSPFPTSGAVARVDLA